MGGRKRALSRHGGRSAGAGGAEARRAHGDHQGPALGGCAGYGQARATGYDFLCRQDARARALSAVYPAYQSRVGCDYRRAGCGVSGRSGTIEREAGERGQGLLHGRNAPPGLSPNQVGGGTQRRVGAEGGFSGPGRCVCRRYRFRQL